MSKKILFKIFHYSFLVFWVLRIPSATLIGQTVVGAYPTYPPEGPLKGKSPEQQVHFLKSMGITLAGGRFKDGSIPKRMRAAGIKGLGLVVLWQGEEHWKTHPESRPVMANGNRLPKDQWYAGVCPNQEWLQKHKLLEIEGMLRSGYYDVITLDFIRYPVHWEVSAPDIPDTCYCPACLNKFQKDTGIHIPRDLTQIPDQSAWIRMNHSDRWYRWRSEQITEFCAKVRQQRDRIRPATLIALAAVPWQASDYDNAIYKVVGQDFRELAKVIEVFSPMSYHVLNDRPVEWIGEVNAYLSRETGRQVWPFVIFDQTKELPRYSWKETFKQALSHGADGLIVFPFPNMIGSEGCGVFQELFGRR